jgi:membrane protease YdiL (CAAX protease family)
MTTDSSPAESSPLDSGSVRGAPAPSFLQYVFLGPDGIRWYWRLLVSFFFFVAIGFFFQSVLRHVPAIRTWVRAHGAGPGVMTPVVLIFGEGLTVLNLVLAALIMAWIERKRFSDYGLPVRQVFGKRFWQGVPFGLAMVTLMMSLIAALHGFSLGGLAIGAGEAAKYGVLYAIGFLLVGIFEEFSFRGYLQATLGSGIGFWPAAIVLSASFGAVHLSNPGEAWAGALMAGGFGIVAALSLERTGSLWFAIGMHAAFDWGETFVYSIADSGLLAQGHLLNSSLHGPRWLTGGSVGPEGSVMACVMLLLSAAAIHYLFPARRQAF